MFSHITSIFPQYTSPHLTLYSSESEYLISMSLFHLMSPHITLGFSGHFFPDNELYTNRESSKFSFQRGEMMTISSPHLTPSLSSYLHLSLISTTHPLDSISTQLIYLSFTEFWLHQKTLTCYAWSSHLNIVYPWEVIDWGWDNTIAASERRKLMKSLFSSTCWSIFVTSLFRLCTDVATIE